MVYDVHPPAVKALAGEGATGTDSLAAFVGALSAPRAVWLMVPAALVDRELAALAPLLASGDMVIDGGNSYYHDDIRRAAELKAKAPLRGCGNQRGVFASCGLLPDEPARDRSSTPIRFRELRSGSAAASPLPPKSASGTAERHLHAPSGAGPSRWSYGSVRFMGLRGGAQHPHHSYAGPLPRAEADHTARPRSITNTSSTSPRSRAVAAGSASALVADSPPGPCRESHLADFADECRTARSLDQCRRLSSRFLPRCFMPAVQRLSCRGRGDVA